MKRDCYRQAFLYAGSHPGWRIIHALCRGRGPEAGGKLIGHAFCERGCMVFDPSSKFCGNKEIYYAIGNITVFVSYTLKRARAMLLKKKTWGPWDRKIYKGVHFLTQTKNPNERKTITTKRNTTKRAIVL